MTLQQMEYVLAVDKYRHFQQAAESCGITQPTLSALLVKLEDELGVKLFERSSKYVRPTAIGEKVVRQAQKAVSEARRIKEMVGDEKGMVSGSLRLSVGPTIAPYVVPSVIGIFSTDYESVDLSIDEMKVNLMQSELRKGEIDAAIAISGNAASGIFEIPLYKEPFYVYLSSCCSQHNKDFRLEDLDLQCMWVMKEAQCFRDSAFSFCKGKELGHQVYQAGSIDTLVRIVDLNGGYTIIPEMHLPFLTSEQMENVRPIVGDYISFRNVSLYIREDEVRQRLIQTVIDVVKQIVSESMIDNFVKRPIVL